MSAIFMTKSHDFIFLVSSFPDCVVLSIILFSIGVGLEGGLQLKFLSNLRSVPVLAGM